MMGTRPGVRGRRDERGFSSPFIVALVPAFVVIAGLVFDGGNALAAKRRANDEAQAAARAGAEAMSEAQLHAGVFELDAPAAVAAAQGYLARTGHTGQVQVNGNDVVVTVHISQPTELLTFIGVGSFELDGTASATPVHGVTGPEP
jgi:Flp pilus assembly protein TadG